ncbi:uncharacterized protein FIESC28_02341 [Fusarium coffeatum]|uniref:Nephrocystin 3-like N-terminal domain-containing protein n=1 Tax=Fusarium coffeatum TaxID=231269 RepID=A0A366S694_9HYPO|nr:uncharacterized protein FIESC28_02341 [Fusarium coffeatum]RBR24851.1 hypothetical protein FIESC28_02341 [Fusarium coffeatum]
MARQLESPELYTIAWIAALPIERAAATALLQEVHKEPKGFTQNATDSNSYCWGRLGEHNIVIASLPAGVYGTTPAAMTASDLIHSLPHIRFGLLVGIGGGISRPVEDQDIRLGDIVVSQPEGTTGGVVQHDFGKATAGRAWEQKGSLNRPPSVLLHALARLQAEHERMPSKIPELLKAMWNKNDRHMTKGKTNYTYPGAKNDRLFKSEHTHVGLGTCVKCDPAWEVERQERDSTDPEIHYGIIASGNTLIKDAAFRDSLSEKHQFLCVEMEAAGLMDRFPCLVIRGICDYADSHKNDGWQRYAAATAAAFAAELLGHVPTNKVQEARQAIEVVRGLEHKITNLSTSVDKIELKIVLDRLPDAAGARFDSQTEEHNPKCLANTRVDLLRDVSSWITEDASKPILWLNGMAGTGKSTIARTVASDRSDHGDLGASFFFKRGEADRGSLQRFVPTIARQLSRNIPGFALSVKAALDSDPEITSKSVAKQFAALVEAPMVNLTKKISRFTIVVDALDECDGDDEIRSLIRLLSRTSPIQHCLRILIKSRPDLPIRLGFAKVSGSYRALILHDMPADTIKHDIETFLLSEFESIRDDFNILAPKQLELPPLWPGQDVIDQLTNMAIPLFIFAATVCRFVKDYKVDGPLDRLSKYLQLSDHNYGTQLGQTYGPVLQSIVTGVSGEDHRQIVEQTCQVVGGFVILAAPLSVMAMSRLLDVPFSLVHSRLNALHSILNIPSSLHEPVRMLHISLRDYLTDPDQRDKNEFWVDREHVHLELLQNSLRVMNDNLKENICRLVWPGIERTDIPASQVATCIADELQYACCYWVYHLQGVRNPSLHEEAIFMFLQKHFFHWIEVLSLLGRWKEGLQCVKTLRTIMKREGDIHGHFLNEILKFLQTNSTVIDLHPLQLYSSLLYSIPSDSLLDKVLERRLPSWLQHAPEPNQTSDRAQYILEGHGKLVGHCRISLDNTRLVSCSDDGRQLRVWALEAGECIYVIDDKSSISPLELTISYDGSWVGALTFGTYYFVVRSQEQFTSSNRAYSDTGSGANSDVSSEGDLDTTGDCNKSAFPILKLWNIDSGESFEQTPVLEQLPGGTTFRFSPNSKLLVFLAYTGAAVVRHLATAEAPQEVYLAYETTGRERFHPYRNSQHRQSSLFYYIEFSPDSSLLTIMSVPTMDCAVWETKTFECVRYQKVAPFLQDIFGSGPKALETISCAITVDASIMVAGAFSVDDLPRPWERRQNTKLEIRWLDSDAIICNIDCQGHVVRSQFSSDQRVLASICWDGCVRTWRVETGQCLTMCETHSGYLNISLSPNFELLSSTPKGKTTIIWANHSLETNYEPKKRPDLIESVILSPDCSLAATSSLEGVVKVWDTDTCNCIYQFDVGLQKSAAPDLLRFTSDNCYLFLAWTSAMKEPFLQCHNWNGHFWCWDVTTGQDVMNLQTNIHAANAYRGSAVSITPDDRWIILVQDRIVTIISIENTSIIREVPFSTPIYDVAVFPDSQSLLVLSSTSDNLKINEGEDRQFGSYFRTHGLSLSMLSIIDCAPPVNIVSMPECVHGILAASLDSKLLVIRTCSGLEWSVSVAILGDTVELLYEIPKPAISYLIPDLISLIQSGSVLLSYTTSSLSLRDSLTGRLVRQFKINFGTDPWRLRFDASTEQIQTNFGTITVHGGFPDEWNEMFSLDKHLTGYGISSDQSWLLWRDNRIFWLPPAFRPRNASNIEGSGNFIE